MALTLFPPRAPSRQAEHATTTTNNTSQEDKQKQAQEQKVSTAPPTPKTPMIEEESNSDNNRISIVPPLPTFASRTESRSASPGPLRSSSNSRQNSPTRAAQNLTPPPTMSLPSLPAGADAPILSKNGRPLSPNITKAHTISKGSYLAGARMKAKETFMRRKGSMPEIKTGAPLAVEQDIPMDSPTIPGRPPTHDRQASLPASAFSAPPFGDAMFKGSERREHKRSASTAKESDRPKALIHKRSESTLKLVETPKTAQTPKFPPAVTVPARSPNPPTPSLQTIRSPADDLPPTVPPKDPAPLSVVRTGTQRVRGGSESAAERPSRTNPQAHKRQTSAQEPREQQRAKSVSSTTPTANKRRSTANRTMPRGMRPVDVVKTLQPPVIASLQTAARKTCEKFAVLSPAEVDTLTAELASLEERCEYLRRTHQSLRSGKKALHMKMLQHLRSDRSGSFSRETLLKQQEALADLDSSIDDWESKMERAETRRAQVHRKLLEHVAAALSVGPAPETARADTPPSTPENRDSLLERTQSIKVYALLADVEHEYGKMFTEARS
ncbi:hypothetical protein TWF481_006778 [Arthrobotrys musiformis]|uniref:Up-regulated during septation protein 1 domain-containing protein n=1 Tax=Arthrobotrys musiformis TaxID=47236 RepID=A0AAV9WFA0_9PEZI